MKCRYEGTGVWAERCLGTKEVDPCPGYEKCNRYKPDGLTNGDRIRAMSDDELADWIARTQIANIAEALEWLKRPSEE